MHLNLSAPPNRAFGAGTNMYSRYNKMTPPHSRSGSTDRDSYRTNGQEFKRETSRGSTPPLLQRTQPPVDYLKDLNLHQEYQGRGGQLVVNNTHHLKSNSLPKLNERQTAVNRNPFYPDFFLPQKDYQQPHTVQKDKTWTVFGVPNDHRTIGQRSYSHTRLW